MGNIRNHLNAEPKARIVVGDAFDASIQDLTRKGVGSRLCRNALVTRKTDPAKVLPEVTIVTSGVAEAVTLQARESHAYLRP